MWTFKHTQNPRRKPGGDFVYLFVWSLDYDNIGGLQSFGAFFDRKLYLLTFLKVTISNTINGGVVNENVFTTLYLNESIAFAAVKPFDRTDGPFGHSACLLSNASHADDMERRYSFHRIGQNKTDSSKPASSRR
jgi:hypothetical protein